MQVTKHFDSTEEFNEYMDRETRKAELRALCENDPAKREALKKKYRAAAERVKRIKLLLGRAYHRTDAGYFTEDNE